MKLWDKGYEVTAEIERFTVGRDREMDMYLAEADVLGSMAHITMLESIGLLEKDELQLLLSELRDILGEIRSGAFTIEDGIEDVHSQVELMLTRRLGDVGKKIHSGRSRNDQVLVDLKLFIRKQLRLVAEDVRALFDELQKGSERYKDILLPGYTHLQVAMPSSFGLWLGAYAESLADDLVFLQAAYRITNRNPLGSAAGYGSSFPPEQNNDHRVVGLRFSRLQCCLCTDGTWQDRKKRCLRTGRHRRDHQQTCLRCLPLQQPKLWLHQIAERVYYGFKHYAP